MLIHVLREGKIELVLPLHVLLKPYHMFTQCELGQPHASGNIGIYPVCKVGQKHIYFRDVKFPEFFK